MIDRDQMIADLRRDEGWKPFAYMDTVGKVTAGCGRNMSDKGLSDAEILCLLNNDIDECVADLVTFPWFPALDAVRQRVMVNMRFNLGPSRFRGFKRMLRAVSEGDYALAATSMKQSLWATQVKGRAVELARQMRTGTLE